MGEIATVLLKYALAEAVKLALEETNKYLKKKYQEQVQAIQDHIKRVQNACAGLKEGEMKVTTTSTYVTKSDEEPEEDHVIHAPKPHDRN